MKSQPLFKISDSTYISMVSDQIHKDIKVFKIYNSWARLLVGSLEMSMNREYPGELEQEKIKEIIRNIGEFNYSGDCVEAILKDGTVLKLLKFCSETLTEDIDTEALDLDSDKATIQEEILELAVENLNYILHKFREKNSLKSRMNGFRAATDYLKLDRDQYVLIMCDGHCFSHYIKNRYKRPFDQSFIDHMNKAAIEAAKHIQGFLFAYVQSDEISFLIHRREGSPFFDYRLQKMVSLVASWVSTAFMSEVYKEVAQIPDSTRDIRPIIEHINPLVFDGRAFNLPTDNDAFAWFLWRQNDCVRNSKQQAAQTYISPSRLKKKSTEEQIRMLFDATGIDWNDYRDGEKYGRLIYKETVEKQTESGESYLRAIWVAHEVTGQFGDDLKKMIKNEQDNEELN